jgi:hypothetical protein
MRLRMSHAHEGEISSPAYGSWDMELAKAAEWKIVSAET